MAFRQLGFLCRKLATAPPHVKLSSYKSLIRPIFRYSHIVWNTHQAYLTKPLAAIQNKALRFIHSKYSRSDRVTTLRNRTVKQTPESCWRIASMKFLYRLYHDNVAANKNDYFKPPYQHSTRTNHAKCIWPFLSSCHTFTYSFFPSTIQLWNKLPHECMVILTTDAFTAKLDELFSQCCLSQVV